MYHIIVYNNEKEIEQRDETNLTNRTHLKKISDANERVFYNLNSKSNG